MAACPLQFRVRAAPSRHNGSGGYRPILKEDRFMEKGKQESHANYNRSFDDTAWGIDAVRRALTRISSIPTTLN